MNSEEIQLVMDVQCDIDNMFYGTEQYKAIREHTIRLNELIVKYRGTEPRSCWGLDDCSTNMLSTCPWRHDCGEPPSIQWWKENNNGW